MMIRRGPAEPSGIRPRFIEVEPALRASTYAQVLRLGSRVQISGQGGWTAPNEVPSTLRAETVQACDRVAGVLAPAGVSWRDVVDVTSFHVGSLSEGLRETGAELRRRTEPPGPVWTPVLVPMLGPGMHLEVKVTTFAATGAGTSEASDPNRTAPTREGETMNRPEFFGTFDGPAARYGSRLVRMGDRLETATHGGWRGEDIPADLDEEIAHVFDNLARTLAEAGASWTDVVALESFHTELDEDVFWAISGHLRERIPDHAPIWTCVGAAGLTDPRMRLEMRVTAISAQG